LPVELPPETVKVKLPLVPIIDDAELLSVTAVETNEVMVEDSKVRPLLSVARIVKLRPFTDSVGIPLTRPVELKVTPFGRLPEFIE
jgi:hypothetical protein